MSILTWFTLNGDYFSCLSHFFLFTYFIKRWHRWRWLRQRLFAPSMVGRCSRVRWMLSDGVQGQGKKRSALRILRVLPQGKRFLPSVCKCSPLWIAPSTESKTSQLLMWTLFFQSRWLDYSVGRLATPCNAMHSGGKRTLWTGSVSAGR